MLRDALVQALNERARQAGVRELDIGAEREAGGTKITPVVTQARRSEPP